MRLKYDRGAGAAYLYLVDQIQSGESKRQVVTADGDVVLDFDAAGKLLGIEIIAATQLLRRETLDAAIVSDWTFSVVEASAGVYEVTGRDSAGHRVQARGTDQNALLAECRREAARLSGGE